MTLYLQMIYSQSAKIKKAEDDPPTEFELTISQALLELQMNSDLKSALRELHITSAEVISIIVNDFCTVSHLHVFHMIIIYYIKCYCELKFF